MYRVRQIQYYISAGLVWLYLSSKHEISKKKIQVLGEKLGHRT